MVKAKYKMEIHGEKIELDTGVLLLCDNDAGEGYVKMEDYFLNKSTLFQIDCLKDWIAELQDTYNELVPVWEDEMKKMGAQEK